MEADPRAGITFEDVYYLEPAHASDEATHFHELVHTIQWRVLGVRDFLLTYGVGIALNGYEQSRLEAIAYFFQAAFERGEPVPELVSMITNHAAAARSQAQLLFAANHVEWGA